MKIPFDLINEFANSLSDAGFNAMLSGKEELADGLFKSYLLYLELCGWSPEDFSKESLSRLDDGWSIKFN